MSTRITGRNRPSVPGIEELYNGKFITKDQRDAYLSKDQEALEKANDEALLEGIKRSNEHSIPASSRRTNSTESNPTNIHRRPSDSGSRNARSVPQKNQERRATAPPSDRASLTFDSIKTTMEKRGFVRIQPFEVRNDEGESAILTFLKAVQNNTPSNHSAEWLKYQEALSKASKSKRDNDEPELFDFQGDDEYEEAADILINLKKHSPSLSDIKISLNWIKDDGTIRIENIGTGKKEVHLAITPDKKFEAFFKT